jgi:penicillin-insensitive murein endopeptidase
LRRHHSHQSGRDADIGFFAIDARGKQVHGPTFARFDASMTSPTHPGARFDVPRTWALVRELLVDPVAHVSHLFVADYLRQRLLAYARPRVPRFLFERAEVTMMQPHDSLPHDDHMHLRISCPRETQALCVELSKTSARMGSRHPTRHASSVPVLHTPRSVARTREAASVSTTTWLGPLPLPHVDDPDDVTWDTGD